MTTQSFSASLLKWWDKHGRKDMPWQQQPNAYKVWVSEVMLQQTQVATVIGYFNRFMQRFENVEQLAQSDLDEVLYYWTGLGYYSRARNLHRSAQIIVSDYGGIIPQQPELLEKLPGIGRSTAGAIAAQAYHLPVPILDGNVKRVLSRVYCVEGWVGSHSTQKKLWSYATELTPTERVAHYTQAIMDLGASLCSRTNPQCEICPVSLFCEAKKNQQQYLYPNPKLKKMIPIKYAAMLILRDVDKVLLSKRPAVGLWSNLYCFPQIALEKPEPPSEQLINKQLGSNGLKVSSKNIRSWKIHKFSHFELHFLSIIIDVESKALCLNDSDNQLWYRLSNPPQVGLAKPVLDLIQELRV